MAATLDAHLDGRAAAGSDLHAACAATIRSLAAAAVEIHQLVGQASGNEASGNQAPSAPARREPASAVDLYPDPVAKSDELVLDAARNAPVAVYASQASSRPVRLYAVAGVALAVDPLVGWEDHDIEVPCGSLFSILPLGEGAADEPEQAFRQAGRAQIAAGLFVYGIGLSLVLATANGTRGFAYRPKRGVFAESALPLGIPQRAVAVAIDPGNTRHWPEGIRLYVKDCLKGVNGPRERDLALRWSGSLVSETLRVLRRGGIFLAPAHAGSGHSQGLPHLVFTANPLAMLVEGAGGAATDGIHDTLDLAPESLTQRVPLVFGSKREVERVRLYGTDPSHIAERAPLFGHRGLFRV